MYEVDERVTAWAARSTPAERRAGPTVHDLGGMAAVTAVATELAAGPLLPFLVQATAHQHAESQETAAPLRDAVVEGLRHQQRHSAFSGAMDALTSRPDLATALGPALTRALIGRLDEAQGAVDDPAAALIGAEAAECLVHLVLAGVTRPAQVLGALDAATEDVARLPEPLAARLPRLVGLLEAHHPGTGLRDALERFLTLDHTCRDAAFELALTDLRDALEAPDHAALTTGLHTARRRLAELIGQDPDRLDAQIYHAALDATLAFAGPDAHTHVPQRAIALRTALHHYRAWRHRTHTPAWAHARQDDITAWARLTTVLDAAATHLDDDDPWYADGTTIITTLLNAYSADRTVTVLTYTPTSNMVEALVAPAIEDAFLRRENRINFLRYALQVDEHFADDPSAGRLEAALRRRNDPHPGEGTETGGSGKAPRRWQILSRTIDPAAFADLCLKTDERTLDRLEVALRTHEEVTASITNPKYSRLMERLVGRLEQSPDWIPDIADPFQSLLDVTVRYAFHAYDVGRTMGGSLTEHLRLRDAAGKKQKVDEALFHQHYYAFLATSELFQAMTAEVINTAGGRVDIRVSFGAVHFNVECKIEEDDASRASLRQYLAQAAEYQNTSASFAILLVLDKTHHAEGTVNLFESIWIEDVHRPDQDEPCHVVTIRVPGGRDRPSSLHTPAP